MRQLKKKKSGENYFLTIILLFSTKTHPQQQLLSTNEDSWSNEGECR